MALTPEQEVRYMLRNGLDPSGLKPAVRVIYDRLAAEAGPPPAPIPFDPLEGVETRTSPETRRRILAMFKKGNRKYKLPFERDRLAMASVMGGNWEEYGQVVLQMAMLDTLLSVEEKLDRMTELLENPGA